MKNIYIRPEMEIVEFETEDIITTSNPGAGDMSDPDDLISGN